MQLRLLQTVADVAAEKNSTLVMPFPVELLRFFEHATGTRPDAEPRAAIEPVTDPSALIADPAALIADPPAVPGLPGPVAPSGNGAGPDRR
jgi:hypothetical protein